MRLGAVFVLSATVACADASGHVPPAIAAQLAAKWSVTFGVDTGVVWHGRTWPAIRGVIDLVPNRVSGRSYSRIGRPAAYGVYDLDFAPWGFSPSGSRPPAIVAGGVSADSVQLQFDSDREGFEMTMTGQLVGDTIRGRWTAIESRAGLGHGPFQMIRLSPCDSCRR